MARAQPATLREVARTHEELAAIGLPQQYLIVNGVLPQAEATRDPLAAAIYAREQAALAVIPESLKALAMRPNRTQAIQSGRSGRTAPIAVDAAPSAVTTDIEAPVASTTPSLFDLVNSIAEDGHGLVMLMGKGGVGKTTLAAAVAVELAHRGLPCISPPPTRLRI